MTSPLKRKLPFILFGTGAIAAAAIAFVALAFFNPPQCPSQTTSQHSSCVIGANIGLGLYLLLTVGVWVLSNLVATVLVLKNICSDARLSSRRRTLWIMLVILIASTVTYIAAALFIGHISDFIRA